MRGIVVPSCFTAIGVLCATATLSVEAGPVWDGESLPLTIEVTQDVPVSPRYCVNQPRATLCGAEFTINKGQRFHVVEMLQEGGCRIVFLGTSHELASCPWMPGFRDHQADIFKVVEFHNL